MRVLMNSRVLFLVLLLLAVVGCKQQVKGDADYVQAHKYFEQGDYEKSFELMLNCAKKGNIEAKNELGWMYENGIGVSQDLQKSICWYEDAASLNSVKSMYNLGVIYRTNEGYYDCDKAFYWLTAAAKYNDPESMLLLSKIYLEGVCVSVDVAKSDYYRDRAVNESVDLAILTKAKDLYWGNGCSVDHVNALKLLKKYTLNIHLKLDTYMDWHIPKVMG